MFNAPNPQNEYDAHLQHRRDEVPDALHVREQTSSPAAMANARHIPAFTAGKDSVRERRQSVLSRSMCRAVPHAPAGGVRARAQRARGGGTARGGAHIASSRHCL